MKTPPSLFYAGLRTVLTVICLYLDGFSGQLPVIPFLYSLLFCALAIQDWPFFIMLSILGPWSHYSLWGTPLMVTLGEIFVFIVFNDLRQRLLTPSFWTTWISFILATLCLQGLGRLFKGAGPWMYQAGWVYLSFVPFYFCLKGSHGR